MGGRRRACRAARRRRRTFTGACRASGGRRPGGTPALAQDHRRLRRRRESIRAGAGSQLRGSAQERRRFLTFTWRCTFRQGLRRRPFGEFGEFGVTALPPRVDAVAAELLCIDGQGVLALYGFSPARPKPARTPPFPAQGDGDGSEGVETTRVLGRAGNRRMVLPREMRVEQDV